jgi:flagellar biosynthesis protein FlhG
VEGDNHRPGRRSSLLETELEEGPFLSAFRASENAAASLAESPVVAAAVSAPVTEPASTPEMEAAEEVVAEISAESLPERPANAEEAGENFDRLIRQAVRLTIGTNVGAKKTSAPIDRALSLEDRIAAEIERQVAEIKYPSEAPPATSNSVASPPERVPRPSASPNPRPKVWAVGGGKGGVGKSLISANFALSLAKRGRRVIAIDLDIGGSNLHTCLGVAPPEWGIGDWAAGRKEDLASLLVNTAQPGLQLVSGSQDPLRIAELVDRRRAQLFQAVRRLDADDVILDLGAGTLDLTVDFFCGADEGIISVLPEPTSVENAYRFIRAVIFRRFLQTELTDGIREVVETSADSKNILGIKTPGDLLAVVSRLDEASGGRLRDILAGIDLSVVINQVRTPVDIDIGRAICSVCRRYFGMDVKYAGYLDYDSSVWKSVRSRKAVLLEYPHSMLANRIDRLTRALLGEEKGLFP